MKNGNRWTKKKMKETCSQTKVMCQSKFYMFTTKRYVLIETPNVHLQEYVSIKTPLLHLQEVCVNWITTFSSPRGMFPLGIETIWGHPLFIPFQPVFLFEFNLSNLLCLGSFLLFEESKCIISPSPPKLPSSIFSITTTCLQLLNIYFTMVKRKFTAMVTPNTYDWIHFNLKHTRQNMWNDKNAFGISKRSHLTRPPQAVVKNQNTWIRMEKTNEWVTWHWVNAKINKESFALFKQIVNIPKENMEDYHGQCLHMPWISSKNKQVWKSWFQNISSQIY